MASAYRVKRWNISIHAPRTGSDTKYQRDVTIVIISIHAPRTGSDESCWRRYPRGHISIHAPRTGSDDTPF